MTAAAQVGCATRNERHPRSGSADDTKHCDALRELLALRALYRFSAYLFEARPDGINLNLPPGLPFTELIERYGSLMADAGHWEPDSQEATILVLQLVRDIAFDEERRVDPSDGTISATPWLDIMRLTAPMLKEAMEAKP